MGDENENNVLGLNIKTAKATVGYEELTMLTQDRSSWRQ